MWIRDSPLCATSALHLLFSERATSSLAYSARGGSSAYVTQCYLDFTLKRSLSRFCLWFFSLFLFFFVFVVFFFPTISLKSFTIPTQETKSVKWRMTLQIRFTPRPNGKATCPLHLGGRHGSQTRPVPKAIPSSFCLWLSDEELHLCVSCQLSQTSSSSSPISSSSKPPPRISDYAHAILEVPDWWQVTAQARLWSFPTFPLLSFPSSHH